MDAVSRKPLRILLNDVSAAFPQNPLAMKDHALLHAEIARGELIANIDLWNSKGVACLGGTQAIGLSHLGFAKEDQYQE